MRELRDIPRPALFTGLALKSDVYGAARFQSVLHHVLERTFDYDALPSQNSYSRSLGIRDFIKAFMFTVRMNRGYEP